MAGYRKPTEEELINYCKQQGWTYDPNKEYGVEFYDPDYDPEIEQRILENDRKIAENERKQEELQYNMAKQIKAALDKGISKADIAQATEFSLEDINSLLEKFYPTTPAEEKKSDFQKQLDFLKLQVENLQSRLDNKEFENVQLKKQIVTLKNNLKLSFLI